MLIFMYLSAHVNPVHILLQQFCKASHFVDLNVADVRDTECVDVAEFSGINRKGMAARKVMERGKVVFGIFRLQNGGNQAALALFIDEHFQSHLFYCRNKRTVALSIAFCAGGNRLDFRFDNRLPERIKRLYRRCKARLLCLMEIAVLVIKIQIVIADRNVLRLF